MNILHGTTSQPVNRPEPYFYDRVVYTTTGAVVDTFLKGYLLNEPEEPKEESEHDYSQDYFTITALEDGTITFIINQNLGTDYIRSISYSTNDGTDWTTIDNEDNKEEDILIEVNVVTSGKVLWKGDATSLSDNFNEYVSGFTSDIPVDVSGNIMSLLYNDNFRNKTSFQNEKDGLFLFLFGEDIKNICNVINAENLLLPAVVLTEHCYQCMFYNCSSLITAPKLPASILAPYCYTSMFEGCTALTTAPELPAVTLEDACYKWMFTGCTSLTTAPELPATDLVYNCYQYMFQNCSSLNYIKAMFISTPESVYTEGWVSGVAATGTFIKNSAAKWDVFDDYGIPSGWTVEDQQVN